MPYASEEEAIAIGNDTEFGLAAYVQSADQERARKVGRRMRAGTVYLNNPGFDISAPFGGYKKSGNGREWSDFGLDEFLETKGIVGYGGVAVRTRGAGAADRPPTVNLRGEAV